MPWNVEIKARVADPRRVKPAVEVLSGKPAIVLRQEDTFFNTPHGRLKLRVLAPDRADLIYYEREDAPGPKPSDYTIFPTTDPATVKAVLSAALGVRGVVQKIRRLYCVGQTRVHLDDVVGLGTFLELEVVLQDGQSVDDGARIARELLTRLGIPEADLVAQAYIDLLAGGSSGSLGGGA